MAAAGNITKTPSAANYGQDDPRIIQRWFGRAGWAVGVGVFVWFINRTEYPGPSARILGVLILLGLVCAAVAWWKTRFEREGKLQLREQLLDGLHLVGGEKILDLGSGGGLMAIGAAKRLKSGKVTAVELTEEFSKDTSVKDNAKSEGVADRVRFDSGFAKSTGLAKNNPRLVFPDGNFDVVMCHCGLGRLADDNQRKQILTEMFRVLAPGGRLLIFDSLDTGFLAAHLRSAGAKDVTLSAWSLPALIPHRSLSASK
jgi:arsenite methyltransferase